MIMQQKNMILSLTSSAVTRIKEIIKNSIKKNIIGLRISVKKGGCAGFEYTIKHAFKINPLDEIIHINGVTILIDSKALLFLLGTKIDFISKKLYSKFIFINPNQISSCGCGESVKIIPVTNLS